MIQKDFAIVNLSIVTTNMTVPALRRSKRAVTFGPSRAAEFDTREAVGQLTHLSPERCLKLFPVDDNVVDFDAEVDPVPVLRQ
jgi:hypothetical protein